VPPGAAAGTRLSLAGHFKLLPLPQQAAGAAAALAVAAGAQPSSRRAALAAAGAAGAVVVAAAIAVRLPVLHQELSLLGVCGSHGGQPRPQLPAAGGPAAAPRAARESQPGAVDALSLPLAQLALPLPLLLLPEAAHPVGSIVLLLIAAACVSTGGGSAATAAASVGGLCLGGSLALPLVQQPLQAAADQAERLAGACSNAATEACHRALRPERHRHCCTSSAVQLHKRRASGSTPVGLSNRPTPPWSSAEYRASMNWSWMS
jgi:hypothetical protein